LVKKTPKLVEGPIVSTLFKLAAPMVVAMIAMVGFNIVDTYFVGRLGTDELAAMGFTFPVILAMSSLTMGVGIGATSVIARAIGQGDHHRIQRLTTDALAMGIVLTVVLAVLGLLTIDPLFRLMGAEGHVLDLVHRYMFIWYLGVPVVVIPQVGNSGIRATGDTKTPASIMITAMVCNVILDPILIFGFGPVPALGLEGAAIATLATRTLAMILSIYVLVHREKMLTLERPPASEVLDSWRKIIFIGLPAGLTQLIIPVSTGIVTSLVAGFGIAAVAGFGVAIKLEMFAIFTVNAMGSALIPFVGQNWGAGRVDRVKHAVRVARWFALGWGLLMWLIALLAARQIAGAFDDNIIVIETVVAYLWIVGASFGLQGLVIIHTSAFNALNKPIQSMIISLLRMVVLYVPVAIVASRIWGLDGIWWAALFANVGTGLMSFVWFDRMYRGLCREHGGCGEEALGVA